MPIFRKRTERIDRFGDKPNKEIHDSKLNFAFSDDIKKWIHGKSGMCKKSKPLF